MTSTEQSPVELVRFRIGDIHYVLPVASVAAILDISSVESAGNQQGSLWIGAISSRQSIIRVASGNYIFGGVEPQEVTSKVVVLRTALPVGFTVDEVLGSRAAARSDMFSIPETAGSRRQLLVHGVVWAGGSVDLAIDGPELVRALGENHLDQDAHEVPQIQRGFDGPGDDALEVHISGSDERWGIPISAVRHVAGYREPQPLARHARDVLGLLAWQRRPIPLIGVASRIGLHSEKFASGQVVVIGEPLSASQAERPALAALLVQQVAGIQPIVRRDGDLLQTAGGGTLRRLDLARLLNGGYRADSRATVFVSTPMPSISMTT